MVSASSSGGGGRSLRVDAFLNGFFGGASKTAEADAAETAVAQVASGEKTRVTVTIARPMGMVLEPLDERKGAVVTELTEGGNADNSGMIEVGDILVGCGFGAPDEIDLYNTWYETILDTLGEAPDEPTIQLMFERALLEDDQDMIGVTADAKRYWEVRLSVSEFDFLAFILVFLLVSTTHTAG